MRGYSLLSDGRAGGGSATGDCTRSTPGSARAGRGALGAGGGWLFSTRLPSGCLKTGNSGLLATPSVWLRAGDCGSGRLWKGSGILVMGVEDRWASILLGGAGGSPGRVRLSSARRFAEAETELEAASWCAAPRPLRPTSGRFRPKRAMPALGELSICFEDTSMEISVRRADAASGLRPPDNSMRLMPVFGERGLEDSEGEDREEWSEFRELRS